MLEKHGLEDIVSIGGKECWSFLLFKDSNGYSQWELKTLFLQEMFARGILTNGSHNMSYAHSDADIGALLETYDEVFGIIKYVLTEGKMNEWLKTEPLFPLFEIR